jgi:hypothetical protein
MTDCDLLLAGMLFGGSAASDTAPHLATCARCRADAPAVRDVAAAFAASAAPAPRATLAPRVLRAAAPLLAAHTRRLPAVAWPRLAAAIAVALLPLPLILLVGWQTLSVANDLLSVVLPARLSFYLVATHAAALALLLAVTYGAVPLLAAHQLRLQHEETHA